MDTVVSLDQGRPATELWEHAGLAREALEDLPVAVGLALSRDGVCEPQIVYANGAFAALTGRQPSPAVPCGLGDLLAGRRDARDEKCLREAFAAGRGVTETRALPASGGAGGAVTCTWTPLRHSSGAGRVWSLSLSPAEALERTTVERLLLRSEQEVARSRALLLEAVESMTDGFVWFDSDGRLVLCNQKYRDLYPRLAGDLQAGASYLDLMKLAFDRDQFTVLAADERAIRDRPTSDPFPKGRMFRTKTSEGRWIEAHNNPLAWGGFIGLRFDVTDQVTAEEALRESEQRFRDFAQSSPGGFWETDESLRFSSFLDVRRDGSRSRPTAAEATGRTLWELFGGGVLAGSVWGPLRQDMQARRPIRNLRVAYASPDGTQFFWRFNGKPYYDRSGRFRGYRGVAEDESAEIEARRQAEAAEARLADAIESISGGFALFDKDDRLLLSNRTYRARAQSLGLDVVAGMTFEEIARANADNGCIAGLESEAAREAWLRGRVAAHQKGEGSFEIDWHDGRTYLMTDRRTREGGIATVSTDITELRLARENAERANRAKTRFLAAASHDLRQPLHAIELFVAALETAVADDDTRAIVGDLREASNAAGRLLNALLDVSELESGRLQGRPMAFPIQQLLERLVRVYGLQARERGLALRHVPSSQVVHSDPHLLERILGNLLSNALRYTPRGRVLLGCRRRGDRLRIEVWDTGIGIPAAERQRIFEEFHQVDNAAREQRRGIGLGLAIVRRLANILGHEIILDSTEGRGSVFAVELALTGKTVALRTTRAAASAPQRPTTVLVIEDDLQIRKGMARLLESWGCAVRTAEDYDAATGIVSAEPDGIDLIIADYRLPRGCSGVRAAGRLRVLCGRMVPVLIVTADHGPEELSEIADQGFPTLQKPVNPDSLRLAMAELLKDFAAQAADGSRN